MTAAQKLRKTKSGYFAQYAQYVVVLLYGVVMSLPLLYAVLQAIKPYNEMFLYPPRFWVQSPTLSNFTELFALMSNTWVPFSRYLFNTVFNTIISTVLHIISCSMAAYPLAKHNFPGKKTIFSIVLWSLMFTGAVVSIPSYLVYANLGMIDTYFAYFVPEMGTSMGLFLMKQNMNDLPNALLESARIDGANEWTILWKVVMPTVKPAWITLAIFAFQRNWNESGAGLIYTETLKTMPVAISQIMAIGVARQGPANASSVLMLLPPIIFFIFAQSNTIKTMSKAGIKG